MRGSRLSGGVRKKKKGGELILGGRGRLILGECDQQNYPTDQREENIGIVERKKKC